MQNNMNMKFRIIVMLSLVLVLILVQTGQATVSGQDTTVAPSFLQTPQPADQNGFGGALFRTILSLLVVLTIIYLGVWVLRKFTNAQQFRGTLSLKILGSTYLEGKKRISVVQVADRYLLLGVTDHSINLITELSPEEGETLFQKQKTSFEEGPVFQQLLKHFRQKQDKNETSN